MIELREYQKKLIDKTREAFKKGTKSTLLVSPVGSGKTVMFSYFCQQIASKGKNVLILCHRKELVDQISETLGWFKVPHGFITADSPYDPMIPVQIASVMTAANRLHLMTAPDVIIIDEAHHAIKKSSFGTVISAFPKAWLIGVTATACRLSGEPLGDLFQDLILGPTVSDLIKSKDLCDYKIFAPPSIDRSKLKTSCGDYNNADLEAAMNKPSITGDAIKEYRKHADGKRAIVFCVNINHSKDVQKEFLSAGYACESLDGTMPKAVRSQIIENFKTGKTRVLTSCMIVSEGFNLPAIEVAIMLRPTKSLSLFIQQTGRALRQFPGKEYAIILDHAGNTAYHGLIDDEHEWSLTGRRKKKSGPPVKICDSCYAALSVSVRICPECGKEFTVQASELNLKEGELVEIDKAKMKMSWDKKLKLIERATTYQEMLALAKQFNYKPGWAWHRWKTRKAAKA